MKNNEGRIHIAIFDLQAEEESILTLIELFISSNFLLSLFLSQEIWFRIRDFVDINNVERLIIFENNKTFLDIDERIEVEIAKYNINIVIFPCFYASC